jgi:8-oxo-dGTP pyrophosphatase MutT (NUDIX family)
MVSLKAESEKYKKEHPKRNVAMVGLRDEDGRILLTRTSKLPKSWHAIGGGIDPEDKTPEAAVIREVKEELGIDLNPDDLTFIITVPYDFGEGEIHYYSAPLSRNTELQVDKDEIVEHKWFLLDATAELPKYNALQTFLGQLQG